MKEENGGPAFPRPVGNNGATHYEDRYCNDDHPGMSLRDYFAGQVLTGIFVNAQGLGEMDPTARRAMLKDCAAILYETADAMLAAREATP